MEEGAVGREGVVVVRGGCWREREGWGGGWKVVVTGEEEGESVSSR